MTFITGGAIIALIVLINTIRAYRKDEYKEHKRKLIIVIVVITLFFGGPIIDSGIILFSYTGLYDLPQTSGYLSEVSINNKSGAPSTLTLNGKRYKTSKEILIGKGFVSDKRYVIEFSPLTKIVVSIREE